MLPRRIESLMRFRLQAHTINANKITLYKFSYYITSLPHTFPSLLILNRKRHTLYTVIKMYIEYY